MVFSRPMKMLENTSRFSARARSWYRVSMPSVSASAGLAIFTSLPWKRIWPSSGWYTPEIILIRVDLPAPLSPRRPTTSPGNTCMSMRSTAVRPPNRFVSPRTSSIASAIYRPFPTRSGKNWSISTARMRIPPIAM